MRLLLTVIIIFTSFSAVSQKVSLVNVDQLYHRLNNGGDTTFIINFWATWCLPCVEELPHFENLSAVHKTEKLKVLLVSVDFRSKLESSVKPFVRKRGIKNEVFLLDEADPQVFINRVDPEWSGAIPATLFFCQGRRSFFEKEFSYDELVIQYKNIKP